MIYRFVIISNEDKDFRRDLRISGSSTFLQLQEAICKALEYDSKEPALFRITDEKWNPYQDVYLYDMALGDADEDIRIMEDTYLDEFLNNQKQRLLFTFDMFGNRSLYLELREIVLGEQLADPEVVRSEGNAPSQTTPIDEFLDTKEVVVKVTKGQDLETDDDYGFGQEGVDYDDLSDWDITSEDEY